MCPGLVRAAFAPDADEAGRSPATRALLDLLVGEEGVFSPVDELRAALHDLGPAGAAALDRLHGLAAGLSGLTPTG